MKALVTFYGVSPYLVWPFEIQFILDFFQNLVHGFLEYNSNHLSGSWARMPSKISPRLAIVIDRKSTRLNSSHYSRSRMPSSA